MPKPIIAVSGKQGQLGSELQQLATVYPAYEFVFAGRDVLDLADSSSIEQFFQQYKPLFFINCAAYTAVDKARIKTMRLRSMLLRWALLQHYANNTRQH